MADTTPIVYNEKEINDLKAKCTHLESEVKKRQVALVRIYRFFDETMHDCKLDLTVEGRLAWARNIAKEASKTVIQVRPVTDTKTVTVGQAGETNR